MSSGIEPPPDLLILGLGNPILRDDRVGLIVARQLFDRLPAGKAVLEEASVGGIELLHVLEGHQRVLIIDAEEPGTLAPGEVREVPLSELRGGCSPLVAHQMGLATCLELGRRLELPMPAEVHVFAIGVSDPYTFSEECTGEVSRAIPQILRFIEEHAFGPTGYWPAN